LGKHWGRLEDLCATKGGSKVGSVQRNCLKALR
jgi:hypothetical protein